MAYLILTYSSLTLFYFNPAAILKFTKPRRIICSVEIVKYFPCETCSLRIEKCWRLLWGMDEVFWSFMGKVGRFGLFEAALEIYCWENQRREWNVISLKDSAVSRSIFSWRIWRESNWKMMILILVVGLEPCAPLVTNKIIVLVLI